MVPTRAQILEMMEKLTKGRSLRFAIPATFGGGVALIEVNPEADQKYILKVAKDEQTAQASPPYWTQKTPKPIAKWVNDRWGEPIG
jgi:hypothetical protein